MSIGLKPMQSHAFGKKYENYDITKSIYTRARIFIQYFKNDFWWKPMQTITVFIELKSMRWPQNDKLDTVELREDHVFISQIHVHVSILIMYMYISLWQCFKSEFWITLLKFEKIWVFSSLEKGPNWDQNEGLENGWK